MNLNKSEFMKFIEKTRKYYDKAQKAEEELFNYIEKICPDVDLECIPSNAENADNIKDAITCYCQYGEYSSDEIYKELKELN